MSKVVPVIPDTAPFSAEQRAWLNGFFAGMFSRAPSVQGATGGQHSPGSALTPLTLLFGSQTGTAESLAKRAAREAGKRGYAATVLDMAESDLVKLGAEKNVLLITSTYGDGEPPDNAKALHALLSTSSSAPLTQLRYSVCSLGDTNYTQFCKCGADFDVFLERLGATRVTPRADCDLDYEQPFSAWLDAALTALAAPSPNVPADATTGLRADVTALKVRDNVSADSAAVGHGAPGLPASYGRNAPFPARVLASRVLNGAGSAKQVHHVEFALDDSGLSYEAGDALGVIPHNCPALVSELLDALGYDGEEAVPASDGSTTSLRQALTECYDLGRPSPELLRLYAPGAGGGTAVMLHHVVDLIVSRADVKLTPVEFIRALKKLQPRLYSISSSPRAHAGQVHLTVAAVRYDLHARARKGVCSTFLAERVAPGESRVGIFVHSNRAFRPPVGADTAMIMVGPGTGIAPFRAFLHERKCTGATGRNWLFFGDQRAATDFLYQDELASLKRDGVLTRLDTAFSRDQAEKIYVQHRMLEHAAELYAWLESGAHFYVCGDAARMAKDVDAALHTVVARAGDKTPEQASAYVQALRISKRYCRDVY
jgi:sulfite reductase (NADPH) flavoprotein alpha-component